MQNFQAFPKYEEELERIVSAIDPLMDNPPPSLNMGASFWEKWSNMAPAKTLMSSGKLKTLPFFFFKQLKALFSQSKILMVNRQQKFRELLKTGFSQALY